VSRGFGQTELLEGPQPKRLIVPEGHVNWWGIDPSSVRVAVATVTPDGERGVTVQPFAGSGLARLHAIYMASRHVAMDLCGHCELPPGVVAIEQPSGRTPNPMLLYATGAIIAGVCSALPLRTELVMVPSATWKAVACGSGAIRKPKPTEREEYRVLRWARSLGYAGSSWDAADAYGVAEWARRTFRLEER
jgi:hypothetical protein